MKEHRLCGVGASPGVVFSNAYVVDRRRSSIPKTRIKEADVDAELKRFDDAVERAAHALETLHARLLEGGHKEHTAILDAHLLMMRDPMLVEGVHDKIRTLKNAEWSMQSTLRELAVAFSALGDDYFKERHSDVEFVGERILLSLADEKTPAAEIPSDAIVVTHALSPANTLRLMRKGLRGFVTATGGITGHTAILARALNIPAVIGCEDILKYTATEDALVIDGRKGEVVVNPSDDTVKDYQTRAHDFSLLEDKYASELGQAAITTDGHAVSLLANIELPFEVPQALSQGAQGVGLYRTEFLFLERNDMPTEDEQYDIYDSVLEHLAPAMPANIRTLDLGSDKMAPGLQLPRGDNPALGLRACRLATTHPEVVRPQLRAIIRAISARKQGSILLPMIGSVAELQFMRALIEETMDELDAEGHDIWRPIRLGVMIELPSAVFCAAELAQECDYFSVGTNDLVQYLYGVDRGNRHVANAYTPFGTAHLRALNHVTQSAKAAGIPVSICGAWASTPRALPLIIALGFDSVSMPAALVASTQYHVRRMKKSEADAILARFLSGDTGSEAALDAMLSAPMA